MIRFYETIHQRSHILNYTTRGTSFFQFRKTAGATEEETLSENYQPRRREQNKVELYTVKGENAIKKNRKYSSSQMSLLYHLNSPYPTQWIIHIQSMNDAGVETTNEKLLYGGKNET